MKSTRDEDGTGLQELQLPAITTCLSSELCSPNLAYPANLLQSIPGGNGTRISNRRSKMELGNLRRRQTQRYVKIFWNRFVSSKKNGRILFKPHYLPVLMVL
ncbi:hypothetical protein ElyMa_004087100 [Elysia marginata]|uniref:Uncharacterized protein n=1 Tax=Elysia marginata TaxID=1093978 RepID=A0AAV4GA80_9GAST|nr:hypothetical protein ElyMa_004087100 [Elysia marginata]